MTERLRSTECVVAALAGIAGYVIATCAAGLWIAGGSPLAHDERSLAHVVRDEGLEVPPRGAGGVGILVVCRGDGEPPIALFNSFDGDLVLCPGDERCPSDRTGLLEGFEVAP